MAGDHLGGLVRVDVQRFYFKFSPTFREKLTVSFINAVRTSIGGDRFVIPADSLLALLLCVREEAVGFI
jgi:hypothetical protein